MRNTLALATLLTLISSTASAQEVTVTPSGEYLMRFRHVEGRDFAPGGIDNFVTHRARVGLKLDYQQSMSAFLQVQDVRRWGSESDTVNDFSANGLDLHQGYFDLSFCDDIRLRVGRQEINYLNQRLIGSVGFSEQMRSFDAARLMIMALDRQLAIDLFYARTGDAGAVPVNGIDDVFSLAAKYQIDNNLQASFLEVVDLGSQSKRVRSTTGLMFSAEYPFGLRASVEGYLQAGSQDGISGAEDNTLDIFAWAAAARLRFTLQGTGYDPFLELFAQLLSGDDDVSADNGKLAAFDPLFGTNHKFYGEADLWQKMLPTQRGLLDLGGILGINIEDTVLFQTTLHVFSAMAQQAPSTPSLYGAEVDFTLGIRATDHFVFDVNYSLLIPGELLNGSDDRQLESFFYFTASASF